MDRAQFVFGILGNISGCILFLAPAATLSKIIRSKSSIQYPYFPYLMTLLSCLLSLWYGTPLVTGHNISIMIVNGIGFASAAICLVVYCYYDHESHARLRIGCVSIAVFAVFIIDVVVSVVVLDHDKTKRKSVCGWFAAVSRVLMYAAPLSAMPRVIQDWNMQSMPLPASVCALFISVFWCVYGALGHDNFISVPNGIGISLVVPQLFLHMIFYFQNGQAHGENPTSGPTSATLLGDFGRVRPTSVTALGDFKLGWPHIKPL